jgi:hypothetical protein
MTTGLWAGGRPTRKQNPLSSRVVCAMPSPARRIGPLDFSIAVDMGFTMYICRYEYVG